jgi:RND family efflux transporter MFP subunit
MGNVMKAAWKPVAGVAGLALLVAWSVGAFEDKVAPGKVAHEPGTALPPGTPTLTVQAERTATRIPLVGTVASERQVTISARIPATILAIGARAGAAVTHGQVLATLDDREIREQLAGAEAQFRQAEIEFRRTQQLFDRNAATDQQRVAALAAFEGAKARVEQARVMLGYATIVAPMDGVVTERRMEAGDLAVPGQPLLTIHDPARMRLEVPAPIRLLPRLGLNQQVAVVLDGRPEPLAGTVREVVAAVDAASRTRTVKILLEQGGTEIPPGTYGHIVVEGESGETVRVPVTAVVRVGQQEFARVVVGGRMIRRGVRTGPVSGDQVEILAGLAAGETIVVGPVRED